EDHGVAPNHGQFAGLVAGFALQSKLVDFKDDRAVGVDKDEVGAQRLVLVVIIEQLRSVMPQIQMHSLQRPPTSACCLVIASAEGSSVFSTTKFSSARQSMPDAKKVFNASDGLETIGSPRKLNEVLISIGTPVRRSKASRIR